MILPPPLPLRSFFENSCILASLTSRTIYVKVYSPNLGWKLPFTMENINKKWKTENTFLAERSTHLFLDNLKQASPLYSKSNHCKLGSTQKWNRNTHTHSCNITFVKLNTSNTYIKRQNCLALGRHRITLPASRAPTARNKIYLIAFNAIIQGDFFHWSRPEKF